MIAISLNYKLLSLNGQRFVVDARGNARLDPTDIETKIRVFEDRVSGWFLRVAEDLIVKERRN